LFFHTDEFFCCFRETSKLRAVIVLINFVIDISVVDPPFPLWTYLRAASLSLVHGCTDLAYCSWRRAADCSARETAVTADHSPSPWSMAVLTWLTINDDALLMVGVAGKRPAGCSACPAAVTAEQSPSPWSMAVLTWLTVDNDALLMVGVAGGGQLIVQHVKQLSQLIILPLLGPWLY
jgi:hypothetical protein